MFQADNRLSLRQQFYDVFEKSQTHLPLSPLETLMLSVIQSHPEYIPYFSDKDQYLDKDFHPEANATNPFLHLGGHIGIREQVQSNRPKGITQLYDKLLKKYNGDQHRVEHDLMEIMMETLWTAQRNNQLPDEQQYIKKCRKLLK